MSLKIKFYLDENLATAIAKGLRRRNIEVLTAGDAGMLQRTDDEQLAYATQIGSTLVTQDQDFMVLHKSAPRHEGIVYITRPHTIGEIIEGLHLIAEALSPDDMKNHIEFL
ncbi:MAG: DUF5615 family PIN-like protein [Ignavibacteriae bacterium]|nr:DUF5615 family PIN-like protein [Ignavibacteriota bacterium]